jgi:hypothetical protein
MYRQIGIKQNAAFKAINAASVADPIVQDDVNAAVVQAKNSGLPRVITERLIRQTKITMEQCQTACDAAYGA